MDLDLSEKYRPKTLADLVGQDAAVEELQGYIAARAAPHLLFHGPPGTGKSTAAQCLIRDWFNGDGVPDSAVLEVNASDDRSVDFMRHRVLEFLRTSGLARGPKFLFFDEADGLTSDAQDLLRRPLEKCSGRVIAIFTANDATKLSAPVRSRFRELEFKAIKAEAVKERLVEILGLEGCTIGSAERDLCQGIVLRSGGDLRKSLKNLQGVLASGGVGPIRIAREGVVR